MLGEGLNDLVAGVYEAPLTARGWTALVPTLEARLRGRVALFVQRSHAVTTIASCTAADPAMVANYEDRLWPEDRAMRKLRSAPVGEIVRDTSLIADRERGSCPFYGGYLGSHGLDRGIYASVARDGDQTLVVSVQRSGAAGDYGQSEITTLRTLAPHLSRSFRIWQQLRDLRLERDAALNAREAHDARGTLDRLGLTPAELRLLEALVAGDRIDSYAARAGIAVSTVKSHLGALFDKTGERRQADLIRRAVLNRWCVSR